MATARSQPKPKSIVANPFGKFYSYIYYVSSLILFCDIGLMMNARQRPTLIQATRAATAFTTGLALPSGYTYVIHIITMIS